ncbi:MAG: hypothetical protein ACI9BD_001343 [Candidatus Marinamargulisbacteria bacterium]|jgi:hypothetical protein
MPNESISPRKILIPLSEVIRILRQMTVKEKLTLIEITDPLYKAAKRKKSAGYYTYEIDITKLDDIAIPVDLGKKIGPLFFLSLLRHGIRPRKYIGNVGVLDYIVENYPSIESFKKNEPVLADIVTRRGIESDLVETLAERIVS